MQMLDMELQMQLVPDMKDLVPLPGIFDPDYIAANQDTRADNVIKGSRAEQVQQVRQHIRQFKEDNQVDKVSCLVLREQHHQATCHLSQWVKAFTVTYGRSQHNLL